MWQEGGLEVFPIYAILLNHNKIFPTSIQLSNEWSPGILIDDTWTSFVDSCSAGSDVIDIWAASSVVRD